MNTSARRQLALSALVAEKIRADPDAILTSGRRRLNELREMPSARRGMIWLDEWADRIDRGADAVIEILLDPSDHGHDMRQMTPFSGVLSNEERWSVLRKVYREVA